MTFPLSPGIYTVAAQNFILFEPDKNSIASSYAKGEMDFPYWSQVWPAAIGLAQFILQNPEHVIGKQVLELAAGLGLPSLVVAMAGASAVTTSDYVPEAVTALQQTTAFHRLHHVKVCLLDWKELPENLTADVLLLSDVSYEEQLFSIQEKVIRSFLQTGTTVILSTPQRLVAKNAMLPLLPFCISQQEITVVHQQRMVAISIFVLQQ